MTRVISDLPSFGSTVSPTETVANEDLLVCHNVSKAVNTRDEKLSVEKLLTDALGNRSVTITSGGSVGIGTASPDVKLYVLDNQPSGLAGLYVENSAVSGVATNRRVLIGVGGPSVSVANWVNSAFFESQASDGFFLGSYYSSMRFGAGSGRSTQMILTTSGSVGIGTTDPSSRLQVKSPSAGRSYSTSIFDFSTIHIEGATGGIETSALTYASGGGGGAAIAFSRDAGFGTEISFWTNSAASGNTATKRMTIANNGNVTISALGGSNTVGLSVNNDGTLVHTASDARMKTDVQAIEAADALAMVDALRPVRYRWNEEHAPSRGEQVEMGLIAQEVQAHVPEVIGTNRDGMLSLEYARLTALLIGAVQALTARVAALEAAAAA